MFILNRRTHWVLCLTLFLPAGGFTEAQEKPASAAAEAVTYSDVLKLLRSGKSEQEILDTLAKATVDVNFVLGESQVQELKKMRVSDEFLEALKKLKQQQGVPGGDVTDFALILDCSGSMLEKTKEGISKMEAAKKTVTDLIQKIPNGMRLTFVIYGHDKQQECNAVKVVRSLSEMDDAAKAELAKFIAGLQPVGNTPIALALRTAGKELAKGAGLAEVALITDGVETCMGDPAYEAAELVSKLKLKSGVNVIGFGLKAEEQKAIEKIAQAGRGKYYNAQTASELRKGLGEVARVDLESAKAPAKQEEPAKAPPVGKKVRLADRTVRAVKVSKPTIEMPAMRTIAVLPAGAPDTTVEITAIVKTEKYDQEIRIPPNVKDERFDIYWVPKTGKRVPLKKDVAIDTERNLVELNPEKCLGLVRIPGKGLPKAKAIYLAPADADGRFVNLFHVQHSSKYGEDMVVPAGAYDLYVNLADENRLELIAQKVEVEAGKVTEVE